MLNNAEFDIEIKDFSKKAKLPKLVFTENKISALAPFSYKKLTDTDTKQIDLLNNLIRARWASGQLLPDGNNSINNCPLTFMSGVNDSNGLVILSYHVKLEDGEVHKALRMNPKPVSNGTIKGWLPWIKQNAAGTFYAQVGFAEGARKSAGVTFQVWVHYRENGSEYREKVVTQFKRYDHSLQNITADLSQWVNQEISIELRVDAGASAGYNWAAWVNPRIVFNSPADFTSAGNFRCNKMSLNSEMINDTISRSSVYTSIMPQNCEEKLRSIKYLAQKFYKNVRSSTIEFLSKITFYLSVSAERK